MLVANTRKRKELFKVKDRLAISTFRMEIIKMFLTTREFRIWNSGPVEAARRNLVGRLIRTNTVTLYSVVLMSAKTGLYRELLSVCINTGGKRFLFFG